MTHSDSRADLTLAASVDHARVFLNNAGASGGQSSVHFFNGATQQARLSSVNTAGNNLSSSGADDFMIESLLGTNNILFGTNGTERMRITTAGNVGIGTTYPGDYKLNVNGQTYIQGGSTGANPTPRLKFNNYYDDSGNPSLSHIDLYGERFGFGVSSVETLNYFSGRYHKFYDYDDLANPILTIDGNTGNVGIGTTSPQHPLHMGSGAHVTTGGVWTNSSSREYKENIRDLTVDEAMQTLDGLRPSRFNYKVDKEDEYVGFIAEDVPELVATRDRKGLSPMDLTAVLTKVVQEQQKMLQTQKEAMDGMKHEIEMLKSAMNYGVKGL